MIVLGLLSYVLSGAAHITALIPAFFGVVIAALGFIALKNPTASRHAMHGAILLSLLAVLGSARVFGELGGGLNLVVISQLVMLGLGLALLIPGIQSFIKARQKGNT